MYLIVLVYFGLLGGVKFLATAVYYSSCFIWCIDRMKDITYWNGKTQAEIDAYPEPVRDRINFELTALQTDCPHSFDDFAFEVCDDEEAEDDEKQEFPPAQKKSMKSIGKYAMQLTIKSTDSYRVIYVAKFNESIYVLHTFKKKTEGVSKKEYGTAEDRYKQLEAFRRKKKFK